MKDRIRIEQSHKRVRAYLGGEVVADSIRPLLVWEIPWFPTYYFPEEDIRSDLLVPSETTSRSLGRGVARFFTVKTEKATAADAVYTQPDSPVEELRHLYGIKWDAMDSWFEEEEEVFVHPRSPYTRIDVLPSSRHVQVMVDGVELADTIRPTLLFETGLPVRYYLPKTDVRMDLLTAVDTQSRCPYKGVARYWSVTVGETTYPDFVWSYPFPLPESMGVAGLLAFYNEKVDLTVDGQMQERPKTPFS